MKKLLILFLLISNTLVFSQTSVKDSSNFIDTLISKEKTLSNKIYTYFDTVKVPIFSNTQANPNNLSFDYSELVKLFNFWTIIKFLILILIFLLLNKILDKIRKNKKIKEKYIFTARLVTIIKILVWLFFVYLILKLFFNNAIEIFIIILLLSLIFIGISFIEVFKNLIGGFYLSLKNPFETNDIIEVKNITGKVKRINWLTTQLINETGSEIHLPNAYFINHSVKNINKGEPEKQINICVKFPINLDVNLLRKILLEAALSSPFTYSKQKPEIYLIESNYFNNYYEFKLIVYCIDASLENQLKNSINLYINNALKTENLLNE